MQIIIKEIHWTEKDKAEVRGLYKSLFETKDPTVKRNIRHTLRTFYTQTFFGVGVKNKETLKYLPSSYYGWHIGPIDNARRKQLLQ